MEWVDVVSDGVKIGLGAFIAGVFALVGGFWGHRQSLSEEKSKRIRDALETAALDFVKVDSYIVRQATSWITLLLGRKEGADSLVGRSLERLEAEKDMEEWQSQLIEMSGLLTVLGYKDIAESIDAYRSVASKVQGEFIKQLDGSGELSTKIMQRLREERTVVMDAFARAYEKS